MILGIVACKKESVYHKLHVLGGSGGGDYELGTRVEISAFDPDSGFIFEKWSGDTTYVSDSRSPVTNLSMPLKDVHLKANYVVAASYRLVVSRGSGTGSYHPGTLIELRADLPQADSGFFEWAGDVQYLNEIKAPVTTLTMPARNISVKAVYRALPRYNLSVNSGFGSGDYLAGTTVNISPNPPANKYFAKWAGDIQFLDDYRSDNTTVTMPMQAVSVTAEFENAVSFSAEVLPLIIAECATSGCHDSNSPNEPLTNYQEVKKHDQDIRYRVNIGQMPPSKVLAIAQVNLIIKWVDQGAMNN